MFKSSQVWLALVQLNSLIRLDYRHQAYHGKASGERTR